MSTYIKKLQSKSEASRKQMLTAWLLVSMSLVVFVWVYNLGDRFSNDATANKEQDVLKPFTLFANSVSQTYSDVSASVGSIKSSIKKDRVEEKQIDLIPVERSVNQ